MKDANRQTRSYLMDLFSEQGFHPRGDLGQNFLIDLNLIGYVVEAAELGPADVVLEVGTGTGGMTTFLAQQAAHVISVDVDPNMYHLAQKAVEGLENVTLLNCDALKNKGTIAPEVLDAIRSRLAEDPERQLKLVANLPYSIATPLVSNLVAGDVPWSMMVITIQWELAQKMRARPGWEDYGALSVWLQSQCRVKVLKKLPPTVFWPRPKVNSAIVRLLPDPRAARRIGDREFFHDFVRRVFTQRRKQLRSVLVGMYRKELNKPDIDVILDAMNVKEGARAEELDTKTLVDMARCIREAISPTAAE
jgi:16S rRNA (adenine1518-N6/adenine1519-N6)-dimethyltransferase